MVVSWNINLLLRNTACMPGVKLIFRLEPEKIIYSVTVPQNTIFMPELKH